MKHPPAFQFYARDWLASGHVRRMTYQERGIYFELLLFSWCDGSIPDNDMEIARLLNISVREWRKSAPRIRPRFVARGGVLVNERLETVRHEQDAHRLERSASGKAGAKKRWLSHRAQNGSAMQQPLANDSSHTATATSTATQIPATGVTSGGTTEPTTAPPPLISRRLCPISKKHAWCDGRMHVPIFVHEEFQRTAAPEFDLLRWYAETDLAWADQTIGDDAQTFWRARWLEEHGSTTQRTGAPRAPTQAVDKPPACTCGDAYRNSFNRRCTDCEGTPSAAQLDATRQDQSS